MTQNEISTLLKTDEPNCLQFLPALFVDSSHQIVLQSFQDRVEVIKIMRSESVSVFWQGMQHLFGVTLASQLSAFEHTYPWLAQHTHLPLPQWLQTLSGDHQKVCAVRSSFLEGNTLDSAQVQQPMVTQLAQHLAQWHSVCNDQFGDLMMPQGARENWPKRLESLLKTLPQATPEDATLKHQILQQLAETPRAFMPDQFVVMMPDLRWDQFLVEEDHLTGLTDLDAVVFGPLALEWVLLEAILTEQQAQWFLAAYQQRATVPEIAPVRQVYRVVLSQLQVLGNQNAQAWLNFPTWFDCH